MNTEVALPQIINQFVLQTIAVLLTALLLPRLRVTSIFGALGMAIAISVANATIWNAGLFTAVPGDLSQHTLAIFFANGVLFWVLVKLLPGIESDGILPCLVAPVVLTSCSVIVAKYGSDIDWIAVGAGILDWVKGVRNQLSGSEPEASLVGILRVLVS